LRWTDTLLLPGSSLATYGDLDGQFQYWSCLHWSLSQMTPGSPPVKPLSSLENMFNIVCLLLGMVLFGSVVSSMTAAMVQWRKVRNERRVLVDELDSFLAQRRINAEIGALAREQVRTRILAQKKSIFVHDVAALSLLSQKLSSELHEETCRIHLVSHPLFRLVGRMEAKVLKRICTKSVCFKVLLPNVELFRRGHVCSEACHVLGGALWYSDVEEHDTTASRSSRITSNGSSLSANANRLVSGRWICWQALWCHWVNVGQAEAIEPTELFSIDADGLLKAVVSNPQIKSLFNNYAASFHQHVLNANELNDLDVPGADYPGMVWCLDRQFQMVIANVALEALANQPWRARLNSRSIRLLQEEMTAGRCLVVETPEGAEAVVERVVSITVVRLTKADGSVLACLLKYKEGEGLIPCAQLPGVKQRVAHNDENPAASWRETPAEALERILPLFAGYLDMASVQLEGPERRDVFQWSTRYRFQTRYLRSVYSANLPWGLAVPTLNVREQPTTWQRCALWRGSCCRRRTLPGRSFPSLEDCFILHGSSGLEVYTWVESEEYLSLLNTAAGRRKLREFAHVVSALSVSTSGERLFH